MFDQNKLYLIEYTNQRGESSMKIISTSPTLFSYFYKNKSKPSSNQKNKINTNPEHIFVIEIKTWDPYFMLKKLNRDNIDIEKEIDFNVDLIEKMGDEYIDSLYDNIQKELVEYINYDVYDIMNIIEKEFLNIQKKYKLEIYNKTKGKISYNDNNQIFPDLY